MIYEPYDYRPNPKFPDYPFDKSKYAKERYSTSSTSTSISIFKDADGLWVAFSADPKAPAILIFKTELEALRYVVERVELQMKVKFLPYGTDLIKVIYE